MWKDQNAKNADKEGMIQERHKGEELARKERARDMMEKLKRSQKAVEAYMKQEAHKNMLQ